MNERGSQLVEFALIAPVLVLLFMGVVGFGWVFHQQIQIDNATRLGARRGAVGEDNATIIAEMKATCTSFALTSDQITIEVRNEAGEPLEDNSDRTPGYYIYVAVHLSDVDFIVPLSELLPINLKSEAEFLIE